MYCHFTTYLRIVEYFKSQRKNWHTHTTPIKYLTKYANYIK